MAPRCPLLHSFRDLPMHYSINLHYLERLSFLDLSASHYNIENRHFNTTFFRLQTGTFRARRMPTVLPVGGVSVVETGFWAWVRVEMRNSLDCASGAPTLLRRVSQGFFVANLSWLKCFFPAESNSPSDWLYFSQDRLRLKAHSVLPVRSSLENYV